MNREQWLSSAIDCLHAHFTAAGHSLPNNIRVSCGWPGGGKKRIGECWHKQASKDGWYEVFISPKLEDPIAVLDVLCHELCHVVGGETDPKMKHGRAFKAIMKAIGLEGKATSSSAGASLLAVLTSLAADLGPYPHAELTAGSAKKQSTRMLKLRCCACECVIRTAQKWLDAHGLEWPCPCGGILRADGSGEEKSEKDLPSPDS